MQSNIKRYLLIAIIIVFGSVAIISCSWDGGGGSGGGGGTVSDPAFITTWETNNTGATGDDQILISTNNGGGNFTIDWGDGVVEHNLTNDNTHIYGSAGIYTVKITGDFPRIYFDAVGYDNGKLLTVENWGDINWSTMEKAFYDCNNLVVNATDVPDLSNVTSMSYMFYGASVFNQPIGSWDTHSVTDMSFMFNGASTFNQDINDWNTSGVTNMHYMFFETSAFNQPLNGWDTSKVGRMDYMFHGASTFNQPIGSWDTSSVYIMDGMFQNASVEKGMCIGT